jgi:hypothetical protein
MMRLGFACSWTCGLLLAALLAGCGGPQQQQPAPASGGATAQPAGAAATPTPNPPVAAAAPGAPAAAPASPDGLSCVVEFLMDGPSLVLETAGGAGTPITAIRRDVFIEGRFKSSSKASGFKATPGAQWPLGTYEGMLGGKPIKFILEAVLPPGKPHAEFSGKLQDSDATRPIKCHRFKGSR